MTAEGYFTDHVLFGEDRRDRVLLDLGGLRVPDLLADLLDPLTEPEFRERVHGVLLLSAVMLGNGEIGVCVEGSAREWNLSEKRGESK